MTPSAGTAGGGLDAFGLVSFPRSNRAGSAWWVHADSRPAHPGTALPPARPRLRGAARAQHPPRAERASERPSSLKAGGGRRAALLPPSRDARAPQRAAAAPPACAPRPAAAWSASAARARAGGSARCDPSTWATSSSPARPTPACSPWASAATTASAASPGTRRPCGGPCGREGPRGATCAALRTATACPAARPTPPHACPL